MKVVSPTEMRRIESEVERRGTSLETLMHLAGEALADIVRQVPHGPVLILVGPGNNGGDGMVAAQSLIQSGREVSVYSFKRQRPDDFSGEVVAADADTDQARLIELLESATVIVDALLGIGQNRAPEGLLAAILRAVNRARRADSLAVACDIPTGVNADNGDVPGEAFLAGITVCMGFPKYGNVLYPGAAWNGSLRVEEVRIPRELASGARVTLPDDQDIASLIPRHEQNSNKGTFGRVLFVGGSVDFSGAPVLSALAAYRIGAGLVQIAVPEPALPTVASRSLETIYAPLAAVDGKLDAAALGAVEKLLQQSSAVVFGPGMGQSDGTLGLTRRFVSEAARSSVRGTVIDADGLNCLAQTPNWWAHADRAVLTPHPGEMSRLTGLPTDAIQRDRLGVARGHAEKWGQVVVLKGAGTVVASPDGRVAVNPTGGPNLASAGTGDVLSGMIGGLIAQGVERFDAAVAAVYIHGRAGDLLARELGDAGTLAGDLLPIIPRARKQILEMGMEQS